MVVPQLADLRKEILKEFHCSRFVVYPSGTKMYHDLHCQYYWSGMNKMSSHSLESVEELLRLAAKTSRV